MQELKQIVRIQHGSHLYGTNTESSDLDFKGVFLPSAKDILLQQVPKVIDRRVKLSTGAKNEVGDVDDQSYPLQKFLHMVASGDTVGTEILFAPASAIVEMDERIWPLVFANREYFINKQCKGFVSYCQRQAAKYGIKGSRMAACEDLLAILSVRLERDGAQAKLGVIDDLLRNFCETHEFAEITMIPQQNGTETPHLDVVDRKIPFSATIKHAHEVFTKVYDNYGHRARAAKDNEGIDWKAISHAVRVSRQAIELLSTGHITFPRPDAEELLAIKQGRFDYPNIAPMLEALVEDVEQVALSSELPEESDFVGIEALVLSLHYEQVVTA